MKGVAFGQDSRRRRRRRTAQMTDTNSEGVGQMRATGVRSGGEAGSTHRHVH